ASSGGTRFITHGGTTSLQISTTTTNTRVVQIFNGQLYTSSASVNIGVSTVGVGLPTTAGQTTTLLTGVNNTNAYDFVFLDRDGMAGLDTVYVADLTGGVFKYSTADGVNWTARGSVAGVVSGLEARIVGTDVVLFGNMGSGPGNTLFTLTDTAAFDATITGTMTTIATASANTVFRGVAFTPTAVVNSAPVLLAAASPVVAPVDEDAPAPAGPVGTLVSQLVDLDTVVGGLNNVTDANGDTPGIAITAFTGAGIWHFSIDNGTTWTPIPAVSPTSALLLSEAARVYYQPAANENGTDVAGITFKAWDQTAGTSGMTADTTMGDAFSTAIDTASVSVTAVNDAPTAVDQTLADLAEDAAPIDIPFATLLAG
ncbi:MAG: hypothetical protein ACRDD1_19105, partial [Planctomycetia bacterium]